MAKKEKARVEEKRSHHRIEVSLPLLVRGRDVYGSAFEDTAASYNVSREGASFFTRRELEVGGELQLTLLRRPMGRATAARDFETTAVIRRLVRKGPDQWEVGVQFTGPRLRTYMPESA